MTPAALLEDLRRRGVELTADSDRLRYRAPQGVIDPDLLLELRRRKPELLKALHGHEDRLVHGSLVDDALTATDSAPMREVRPGLGAALIDSPRYGQVWVALDHEVAAELIAEERERLPPRPVLFAEDLARLRGKAPEGIRAALEVARAFPGARVI